jgi:hypothetical protein
MIGECFICKRKLKRHDVHSPTGEDIAIAVKVGNEEHLVCLEHPGVEEFLKCKSTK